MTIQTSHLQQLYRIATADRAIYVFRDRLNTGGGITPAALTHLHAAGLIAVGDVEPALGRRLTITPAGRAALVASLSSTPSA